MKILGQFSVEINNPMFNPLDTGSDLVVLEPGDNNPTDIFTRMQLAVGAILLPLPFLAEAQRDISADKVFTLRKERLALKLVDSESLSTDPDLESLLNAKAAAEDAGTTVGLSSDPWRDTQRFSIGAAYDLVIARLSSEQKLIAKKFAKSLPSEAASILKEYVTTALDQLLEEGLQWWLVLAQGFNSGDNVDLENRPKPIRRLTIALNFPHTADDKDAPDAIRIFTDAALKAISGQDLNNANRFAGLALRASEANRRRGTGDEDIHSELQYLNAVTSRVSICSVDSHLRPRGSADDMRNAAVRAVDQINTMYAQASQFLDPCLARHANLHMDETGSIVQYHAIRYLRSLSERASLNMFMATSLGLRHKAFKNMIFDLPRRYLNIARGDLKLCLEIENLIENDSVLLDQIQAQFIPNIACYEVLEIVLGQRDEYNPFEWSTKSLNRIWDFWRNQPVHALLAAELTAFAGLANRTVPQERTISIRDIWNGISDLEFPLDRALAMAIHRKFLKTR